MPLMWLVFFVLFLPFIIFVFFFHLAAFSFTKLGLSPEGAVIFFGLCLLGGYVNIPLSKKRFIVRGRSVIPFLFYYPPQVYEQVISVNLGGAVVPVLFSLYLLERVPLGPTLLSTIVVITVAKFLARPVVGVGITLPAFIPPLLAAGAAIITAGDYAAPVAYIAGVWGTLIGADLLNLRRMRELGGHVLSIGGAGVFDGIFLVGIIAAFLA